MRLFITKQSCGRLLVSGSIPDDDAKYMDACEQADPDNFDQVLANIESDNKLLKSIYDCDHWDDTVEELLSEFSTEIIRWHECKNSNDKFRYDRAMMAVRYLERIA